MISVSKAEGEPMELQCTAECPPDFREAIQLGERFMSIFKRSARAFRAPRIARQRMLPPPEYPRIQIGIELQNLSLGLFAAECGKGSHQPARSISTREKDS